MSDTESSERPDPLTIQPPNLSKETKSRQTHTLSRRDFLTRIGSTALLISLEGCWRAPAPSFDLPSNKLIVIVRNALPTYSADKNLNISGFEADLLQLFAREIGRTTQFIVVNHSKEALKRLESGEAHMAAAWLSPETRAVFSPPYFETGSVFVQHENSAAISQIDDLAGKTIYVVAGSRQAKKLHDLAQTMRLYIVERSNLDELELLELVAKQKVDIALVDSSMAAMGSDYWPVLHKTLPLGNKRDIVWRFTPQADNEMVNQAAIFIVKAQKNGTIERIRDRYFGHVERMTHYDKTFFIKRIRSLLPRFRSDFKRAQEVSGFDWRLLASLAYQESTWNPNATSPTGVRGIMMLTNETAEFLKISNRLNPQEAIIAGAKYLAMLHESLPKSIPEPDRTWVALAAYNLGRGHITSARSIAESMNIDANSWVGLKQVLPLLSRPEYYNQSKYGRARGGEAVILVENIRAYHETLIRHEQLHINGSTIEPDNEIISNQSS